MTHQNPKADGMATREPRATGSERRAGDTGAEHGESPSNAPRERAETLRPPGPGANAIDVFIWRVRTESASYLVRREQLDLMDAIKALRSDIATARAAAEKWLAERDEARQQVLSGLGKIDMLTAERDDAKEAHGELRTLVQQVLSLESVDPRDFTAGHRYAEAAKLDNEILAARRQLAELVIDEPDGEPNGY